jgi:hypothetical protein
MADSTSGYRALQPIAVDGVRAYNVGDPVPAENVEAHGYVVGEQVEQVKDLPDEDPSPHAPTPTLIPESPAAAEAAEAEGDASTAGAPVKKKTATPPPA